MAPTVTFLGVILGLLREACLYRLLRPCKWTAQAFCESKKLVQGTRERRDQEASLIRTHNRLCLEKHDPPRPHGGLSVVMQMPMLLLHQSRFDPVFLKHGWPTTMEKNCRNKELSLYDLWGARVVVPSTLQEAVICRNERQHRDNRSVMCQMPSSTRPLGSATLSKQTNVFGADRRRTPTRNCFRLPETIVTDNGTCFVLRSLPPRG